MTLVYVLDLDYNPCPERTDGDEKVVDNSEEILDRETASEKQDNKTKRCSFLCKPRVHEDKRNNFIMRNYSSRFELIEAIKKRTPDIVLFDLYSKDTNKNCEGNEADHCAEEQNNDGAKTQNLNNVEAALADMQDQRHRARKLLENDFYPTGIDEMIAIVESTEIDIEFPIAIFSRYGRQLITTEEMLRIQKVGAYFVWKGKDYKAQDRQTNGFLAREQRSINDVIRAYNYNITRFDRALLTERSKMRQAEQQLQLNKIEIVFEWFVILFFILAALIHSQEALSPEISGLTEFLKAFFPYEIFSPILIVAAVYYGVSVTKQRMRIGIIAKAQQETSGIIDALVNSRKSSNR